MTATDRAYEILAIMNDNFETLSPEQQEHVMAMFCAKQKYRVYKITPEKSGGGYRPTSNFTRGRKAKPN